MVLKKSSIFVKKKNFAKKKINLIEKLINYLLINGHKHKSEKFILLSFKSYQKNNEEDIRFFFKEAVLKLLPTFLLKHIKQLKRKNRKERYIPFLVKKRLRISHTIKVMAFDIKKKEHSKKIHKNIIEEVILSAEQKSKAFIRQEQIKEKIMLQKKFLFFRWF
jgi:ribosomal protein S7